MVLKYLIEVQGRVQGVFYRASAMGKAKELNISGSVENLNNGNVFIKAEGTKENLDLFLAWCKIGPIAARVDNVTVTEMPPDYVQGFIIVR